MSSDPKPEPYRPLPTRGPESVAAVFAQAVGRTVKGVRLYPGAQVGHRSEYVEMDFTDGTSLGIEIGSNLDPVGERQTRVSLSFVAGFREAATHE